MDGTDLCGTTICATTCQTPAERSWPRPNWFPAESIVAVTHHQSHSTFLWQINLGFKLARFIISSNDTATAPYTKSSMHRIGACHEIWTKTDVLPHLSSPVKSDNMKWLIRGCLLKAFRLIITRVRALHTALCGSCLQGCYEVSATVTMSTRFPINIQPPHIPPL